MKEYIAARDEDGELVIEREIVRCKDCKRGSLDQSGTKGVWCPAHAEWQDSNWFCADGERKEGA